MAIVKEVLPYEFLARWKNGVLVGQHAQYIEKIYDDVTGEVYAERPTDAKPVHEAGQYPLADLLGTVTADNAKATEQLRAEKDAANAAKEAAETAKAAVEAERDSIKAERDAEKARADKAESDLVAEKAKGKS